MRTGELRFIAATFIAGSFAALALVACSSDTGAPVTGALGETRDAGDIYGYVYDAEGSGPISGVYVAWYCVYQGGHVLLGETHTNSSGYYRIADEPFWESHQGHDFVGEASAAGYITGYAYIQHYDGSQEYQKDFNLEPE